MLVIGYTKAANQFYIDRSASGIINFEAGFGKKHIAPRFITDAPINLELVVDRSSIELFADDGLTVMTDLFFPNEPISSIVIKSNEPIAIGSGQMTKLKTLYK